MQLGMIGLGRMGSNMVGRLMAGGHDCVVYDQDTVAVEKIAAKGARGSTSLEEFVGALALSPDEKMGVEDPLAMEKLADALPVERAASRWIVSDDPDEHIEQIAPYVDLGFSHLVFHTPGPDQERFLRLYAKKVLPRIRKRFG